MQVNHMNPLLDDIIIIATLLSEQLMMKSFRCVHLICFQCQSVSSGYFHSHFHLGRFSLYAGKTSKYGHKMPEIDWIVWITSTQAFESVYAHSQSPIPASFNKQIKYFESLSLLVRKSDFFWRIK